MDDKIFSNDQDKLNWMYKTPGTSIDREEYLLGRPVDKTFELALKEEEQGIEAGVTNQAKNCVDHECVPPSIRDLKSSKLLGVHQVDLNSKLKDDPLTLIKKQQTEQKRKLIESQLKRIKTMESVRIKSEPVERNKSVSVAVSRSNSLVRSKSDSLDDLLYENFLRIRKFVKKRDLKLSKKSTKKAKKSKKRKRSPSTTSSSSDSESSSSSSSSSDSDDKKHSRNHNRKSDFELKTSKKNTQRNGSNANRPKLTDEERKRKLDEMVSNADWREQDIRKKVTEAHKHSKDDKNSKYNREDCKNSFISKTYMNVANSSTIENQIKSKIQFNQKSKSSMNSNFCRK